MPSEQLALSPELLCAHTCAFVTPFARLLWWGPLIMQAVAVANIVVGSITGHVLDWVILPPQRS
jgi:hypothetical protein